MPKDEERDLLGPVPLAQVLPKPPSRIKRRLIESSVLIEADDPDSITYMHTIFCQTGLPYRNPGPNVREWNRRQGSAFLTVEAGRALHPEKGGFVALSLPYGAKPRLILCYLNSQALKTNSPMIEVEDTLTAFVKRLGLASMGRNMTLIKNQLSYLSAATVRLGIVDGQRAFQIDTKIVGAFDLWFPKDVRQCVLWPSVVQLSRDYFESLQRHAVPLDERAIAGLSHSAMGLDVYAWLAQRLHRVETGKPAFVPWTSLKAQFGVNYARMRKFREVFRQTLGVVLTQYRGARVELDDRGMTLRNSPSPIKGRTVLIHRS
jgi:hypothetical protein